MQKKLLGIKTRIESFSLSAPFSKIGELTIPWILFLALLSWGWRVYDLFHAIPYYGDVLEVVWGIAWYGDHLIDDQLPYFPLIFHPEGWNVAVFGYGPGMFIPLLPLYKLGGAAFAYNAAVLVSFFIAFAGMYNLARRVTRSCFAATLAALLFTFWGFRWLRIAGHLNILIGSALLSWIVWCLERGFHSQRRFRLWFVIGGVLWAIASANSFYFLLIGGFVLAGWVGGRFLSHQIDWRTALGSMSICTLVAALLNIPTLFFFIKGNESAASPFYDIFFLNSLGASLNSIPIPSAFNPWLGCIACWLYRGPLNESGVANFGLLASIIALISLRRTRQEKETLPFLFLTGIGLMLALGFTLKWDDRPFEWDVLRPVNALVWRLAHRLKPEFFPSGTPPIPFDNAILMPGLMLAVLVPFVESVRVLSRYALIAAIGFFPLVSKEVGRLTWPLARVIVGTLLIIEIIPDPSGNVPFPPASHPAFEWLKQQSAPEDGIVDLYATGDVLRLLIGGETLWATQYHGRATISGASSTWPAHTWFLYIWLSNHPHPFLDSDFIPLLRSYKGNYIVLHLQNEDTQVMLKEAQFNPEVNIVQCFDPPIGPSPWSHPICILKILPSTHSDINVFPREGWSAFESWGMWAEGTESRIQWVATAKREYRLRMTAFPQCVSGKNQSLSLEIKEVRLLTHEWQDCEPSSADIVIPAALIKIGWNDIDLRYAYAVDPATLTGGANSDRRMLSVGFTKLEIER